jgi:hypothetical protein
MPPIQALAFCAIFISLHNDVADQTENFHWWSLKYRSRTFMVGPHPVAINFPVRLAMWSEFQLLNRLQPLTFRAAGWFTKTAGFSNSFFMRQRIWVKHSLCLKKICCIIPPLLAYSWEWVELLGQDQWAINITFK